MSGLIEGGGEDLLPASDQQHRQRYQSDKHRTDRQPADTGLRPPPSRDVTGDVGEDGGEGVHFGLSGVGRSFGRGEAVKVTAPSSALRAPSPSRGEGGVSGRVYPFCLWCVSAA